MKGIVNPETKILWRGRPTLWHYFFSICAGLFLLPLGVGWLILLGIFTNWRACNYVISTMKVGVEYGLFVTSTRELRIADIRSIEIRRRGFSGLFGIGSLVLSTAARDDASVVFRGIADTEDVADLVRDVQDGRPVSPAHVAERESALSFFIVFAMLALVPIAAFLFLRFAYLKASEPPVAPETSLATHPTPRAVHSSSASAALASKLPVVSSTPTTLLDSQREAVRQHPALAVAGSPFNKAFLAKLAQWKASRDPRLDRTNWPEVLADSCAAHP